MISYDRWRIGKLIICVFMLLSIGSALLLTEQIECVQFSFGHATILKSEPHKFYGLYTRQPQQAHRFHWTIKENGEYDFHSESQVNSAYFSVSPNNKSESVIAKMMMDRFLMPIKLNSTFI